MNTQSVFGQGRPEGMWHPGTTGKKIMIKLYNTMHNAFVPTFSNFIDFSWNQDVVLSCKNTD